MMSSDKGELAVRERPDRRPVGRGRLTRERILQTSIEIGDSESLDALTMRRLARELGVGTMTLYGYFRDKDELLNGVADTILGSLALPAVEGLSVREGIPMVALALRDMMREHPSVVRLLGGRSTRSERAMRGSYEGVIDALIKLGLEPQVAVRMYGVLLVYCLGFATYESPRPWGRDEAREPGVGRLRQERRTFYASLPKDDFPAMTSLADVLVTLPTGEQFLWGLDLIIDGLLANTELR